MKRSVSVVYNRRNTATNHKRAAIEFVIYLDRKQYILSSGVSITKNVWNKKAGAVKDIMPGADNLNKKIFEHKQKITQLLQEPDITIDKIKADLNGDSTSQTFNEFWKKETNSESIKPQSLSSQRQAARVLDDVSPNTPFKDVGYDLAQRYLRYLIEVKKLSPTTTATRIKDLRKYAKRAFIKGHITSHQLATLKEVRVKRVGGSNKIYLDIEELKKIHSHNLSFFPALDREADRFLIGAFTGLRYSDFSVLVKENFKEKKGRWYVYDTTVKTNDPLVIPIHPIVLEILQKYNFELPTPICNQDANKYIKQVCAMSGIDNDEIKIERKGNERKETIVPKYSLVSTHTARRSAATNMFLAGITPKYIMRITGHKSESSFMEYICATNEQVAVKLSEHHFFQ